MSEDIEVEAVDIIQLYADAQTNMVKKLGSAEVLGEKVDAATKSLLDTISPTLKDEPWSFVYLVLFTLVMLQAHAFLKMERETNKSIDTALERPWAN